MSESAEPNSTPNRRRGLIWTLASAVGGALMVIPWKLANEVGDPSHSVSLLLGVAALAQLTSPPITLVLDFVLLSHWPEAHELLGGAIMTAGIAIPLSGRTQPTGRAMRDSQGAG